jgi:hypothetical protein
VRPPLSSVRTRSVSNSWARFTSVASAKSNGVTAYFLTKTALSCGAQDEI